MQKCLEGTEVTTRTSNTDFIIGSKRTGLSSDSLGTHPAGGIFPQDSQEQRVPGQSALIRVARTGGNNQRAEKLSRALVLLVYSCHSYSESLNDRRNAYLTCVNHEQTVQQNISSG